MAKRVFLIVLDSVGIGALPDAAEFGDEGSNTLKACYDTGKLSVPNLERLGLFRIDGNGYAESDVSPVGRYARLRELSKGKDTTTGHWEMMGILSERPFPTYPNGFPSEVIEEFERRTGRKTLCNRPYSGTAVIADYGEEQRKSGALIVYTSADSVFQIAAHEDTVPVEELYRCCEAAREILWGEHAVGRVIARPFEGEYPFRRTPRRHDFSLLPPKETVLDRLSGKGLDVIGVGKIHDIFAGKGLTESRREIGNDTDMRIASELQERDFHGLCFVNLVDFDMLYGHRNDAEGYTEALNRFDGWLGGFMQKMRRDDVLMITADHGCDPSTPSTDHSREYVPLLVYGAEIGAENLGTLDGFARVGETAAEQLTGGELIHARDDAPGFFGGCLMRERICRADAEDLREILRLQYLAYQSEADLFGSREIPPLRQTLEELTGEYHEGIILKLLDGEGQIIGSVRAWEDGETVYIGKLMVHPQHRRRGFGTGLLKEIEGYFPGKRYELFTSTRSRDNIRLYRKNGYRIFDQKSGGGELSFVYLEKYGEFAPPSWDNPAQ